jgi:hypothetical protein
MTNLQVVRRDNKSSDPGHLWSRNAEAIILWESFLPHKGGMNRPIQVETARTLMTEAMKWSVMKWLREKKNVRKTADQANAALDKLNREAKQHWPDGLKSAYDALESQSSAPAQGNHHQRHQSPPAIESETSLLANKMKDANDEAYRARAIAEEAFDEAEKQLSTRLAREGCLKAIHAWDMLEEVIRKAENIRF